jgi:5'-nucleotidase
MRILLTNDDGFHAEGLECLRAVAAQLSDDVWVAAPELEQSGASRALTLSKPITVKKMAPREWMVAGTPTDCVLLAVQDLIDDGKKPDLILSGVNRGQNLAEDVTFSGTVAGALQGRAMGIPSIALSQTMMVYHDDLHAVFETALQHAPGLVARLVEVGWSPEVILNINFPDLPPDQVGEVEVTRQGQREIMHMHAERRSDLRGRDYYWMGFRGAPGQPPAGTDLAAVYGGRISVTPLHVDLTHQETVFKLKGLVGGAAPKLKAG